MCKAGYFMCKLDLVCKAPSSEETSMPGRSPTESKWAQRILTVGHQSNFRDRPL